MKHPVFVLMLWLGIFGTAVAVEPVSLVAGLDAVPLAGHIEYLRDDSGELTLDDVRSPQRAARFLASDTASFNYGYTHSAYWFRVSLKAAAHAGDWALEVRTPSLDYVDIHIVREAGVETFLAGDLRPRSPRLMPIPTIAVPFSVTAGESLTLYVRTRSEGATFVPLVLRTQEQSLLHAADENLMLGAFFGVILIMALYNLLIYAWIREKAYLYYVLYILSMGVLTAFLGGYLWLYGNALSVPPAAINIVFPVGGLIATLFAILFFREVLHTRQQMPRTDRLLLAGVVYCIAVLLLSPWISYMALQMATTYLTLLVTLTALYLGFDLARKGSRTALLFLLGNGFGAIGILIKILESLAKLPINPFTHYAWQVGICLDAALLSLALADRLNTERREKERLGRLRNFFAPQVAEAILDEGGSSLLAPKRREVTVVFTDLRGFTALAAQSEPEDVIRVLREYHEAVVETSAKHGGNVEHIAGDGVMVYFNAPIEVTEPEARAVRMAFELRSQFETLCQTWRKRGHELGVGIGMACGFATVGAVGAKGRMDYSCIGTVTNLAARLCGLAKHGQILVPQLFVNRVEARVTTESLGEQELKGMPKPVAVFNLVAATGTKT